MVGDDLGWPDGGEEGDCLMTHHKFGQQILEPFSAMERLFNGGSQLGSVVGNSGNLLKATIWLAMTWAGQMVAVKLLA